MPIARRLKWYLDSHDVPYEVVHHSRTMTARDAARSAHLPTGRVAKCVLLEDERGYVMAIVPASCRVSLGAIRRLLDRDLELATEGELAGIFGDCELGAIPATGLPYNIPMLIDESLMRLPDLYFEAGGHEDLVHVSDRAFGMLAGNALRGRISELH
jgi:Ala-tRNA(Pro) deacylase